MDIQHFKENPSLEELEIFTRKELFEVATLFEIKLTSLALRKKQLRDEIVIHLVNNELISEEALETIQNENDGSVANSSFEIQFKIKQMELDTKERIAKEELERKERMEERRLQMEREELGRRLQMEKEEKREKLEKELKLKERLEKEKLDRELEAKERIDREKIQADKEIALKKMEQRVVKNEDSSTFDPIKLSKMVPKLTDKAEKDIDKYLSQFELVAKNFSFPVDKWTLLLQTALTGKAAEVFLSLSEEQQKDYQIVKDVILKAYQCVPESYRKSFRTIKKQYGQTYVEFLREKERFLERWMKSKNISSDFEKFKNLILMEEFQNCVTSEIRTHITDRSEDDAHKAAVLADNFSVTHQLLKPQVEMKFNKYTAKSIEQPQATAMPDKKSKSTNESKPKMTCYYCKREGHLRQDCQKLKKRNENGTHKVDALVSRYSREDSLSISRTETTIDEDHKILQPKLDGLQILNQNSSLNKKARLVNSSQERKPTESFMSLKSSTSCSTKSLTSDGRRDKDLITSFDDSAQSSFDLPSLARSSHDSDKSLRDVKKSKLNDTDVLLEDFKPFISEGSISLPGDQSSLRPIKILRDTGASQSLLLEGILPLSESTYTGRNILLRGVELGSIEVPLHQVGLKSDLISGLVVVGVRPTLPLDGISLLLGNDLAGGKVIPDPIVTHEPQSSVDLEEDLELYPACAVTRSMSSRISESETVCKPRLENEEINLENTFFARLTSEPQSRENDNPTSIQVKLIEEQKKDHELSTLRNNALTADEIDSEAVCYYVKDDILFRKWRPPEASADEEWRVVHQIVVPNVYRKDIMHMAHDSPLSGHLGIKKTYSRIIPYFYWPKLKKDVTEYCRSCHTCQVVGKPNQTIPAAPLKPIPAFDEAFSRVIIDCVGPLPKTKAGHQYLLTIMCASTRFPEAIPLRNIKTTNVVKALTKFFTLFGLPKSVQTDQGTNFTSGLFKQVMNQLEIPHVVSSAYHPESQGALERFHQTLKTMIKTYCQEHEKDWDEGVPLLLFAAREAVQESLGFSPFELVFGHTVRGPLKLLKETWMSQTTTDGLLAYVDKFKNRLFDACNFAKQNLKESQKRMKVWYDKNARTRNFSPGDKVLVFLPNPGQPLQAKYFGPYVIESKVSDVNYVIKTPDRKKGKQLCHINMLKPYISRNTDRPNNGPVMVSHIAQTDDTHSQESIGEDIPDKFTQYKLKNSDVLTNLDSKLSHLPLSNREVIKNVISEFSELFSDVPKKTNFIEHDVDVGSAIPIKQHPYRVNPIKLELIRNEIQYMLDNDIIEHSSSNWSSPCLLVPKADKTYRFCTDFRKVNSVTKTDSFPIPRIDDLIDRVGDAKYVTKIDMLSGYWQVPLSSRAREISAFSTPDGLYQYKVMPFGMKNAPATFQRLINNIIADQPNCSAYIDDIIIYSKDFISHVRQIRSLFKKLSQANLTINLKKSEFGHATIEYLGHIVGSGQVKPVAAKIEAIIALTPPSTRKQLMKFLGMAGYYRKFCPNFSVIATPLTNLLKKNNKFIWSDQCQKSFESLKSLLTNHPVLIAPNFEKPYSITVDASDEGMGAVLCQKDENEIDHPVCYYSKKFNPHQKNYSTIEKECLGLMLALQHFDFYISNSTFPIMVFTDHNPLTFLSKTTKNQRLLRWSLFLQTYNLEIKHIKGKDNILADTLSRL